MFAVLVMSDEQASLKVAHATISTFKLIVAPRETLMVATGGVILE